MGIKIDGERKGVYQVQKNVIKYSPSGFRQEITLGASGRMTIQEAIRKMAAAGTEPYCKVCTVDAVDEDARTVDCTPLDEGAPLVGVNLQANQECGEGVVLFPAVGSYVVVSFLGASVAVVVLAEKVDKIDLKIGDTSAEIMDGQVDIAVRDTTAKISPEGLSSTAAVWAAW